jgi:hypothetical protein
VPNAYHNGLGEMATFLSVFSKKVTACPIPLAGTGYKSFDYVPDLKIQKPTSTRNCINGSITCRVNAFVLYHLKTL